MQLGQALAVLFELLLVLFLLHGLVQGDVLQGHGRQERPIGLGLLGGGLLLQCGADALIEPIRALELRLGGQGAVDDLPGRVRRVGGGHEVVKRGERAVVVLVLAPIVFADAPGGVLVALQRLDALALALRADVQEELDQQVPARGELPLKDAHALDAPRVLRVREVAAQALAHRLVHPAGVEEEDLPLLRDALEVAL